MSRYYNYGNLAEKSPERKQKQYTNYTEGISKRSLKAKLQLNTKLRMRCFCVVALVSVMAMFIAFRSGAAASEGYELVKMKQSVASLQGDNARLRLDIAKLKSPERIKTIAVKNLGMVLPPQIYFANKNR